MLGVVLRHKGRFLSLTVASIFPLLSLLFLVSPITATAQLTFVTNGGSITITGYIGNPTTLNIPATTNGWPVASIADSAFLNKSTITTVIIPDSVSIIGNNAFDSCTGVTNLIIGQGVLLIGNSAFKSCTKLGSVAIPDSVKILGTNVFYSCSSMTNFTLGAQVTSIGNSDFENCPRLAHVLIPNSVTNIGNYAFYNSTFLRAVTLPTNVVNIGKFSFSLCTELTNAVIPNGVRNIDSYAFFECYHLAGLVIPDSVTNVADGAFCSCNSLTNLTFGKNLANIGAEAFSSCLNLGTVAIPDTVTNIGASSFDGSSSITNVMIGAGIKSIGGGSFWGCSALQSITVNSANLYYCSVGGVLFDKSQGTLVQFPMAVGGDYSVPNTVTALWDGAFIGCTLTNVAIPGSVTNIAGNAFMHSTNLLTIAVAPDNADYSSIDGALFDKNHTTLVAFPGGLKGSYTIPNGVTNIDYAAFDYCSLTSVTIPKSVTKSLGSAFSFCSELTAVFFGGNAPSFNSSTFLGVNATAFYLPGTTGWSNTFVGLPTALWNPQVLTSDGSFGFQANQFGFKIVGTTNIPIVVEACNDLGNPTWTMIQNCTLTNGVIQITDSESTNEPSRFYRIRSP